MSKKVYRLENADGHGPFHGDQRVVGNLQAHFDPEAMMKSIGYPKEVLVVLSKAGFVFGWRTRKLYRAFFKKGGESVCRANGFTCRVYEPALKFVFPDGQVIFSREDSIVTPTLVDLLNALGKYPKVKK